MTTRMPTAISSLLKTSLDRLYAEFNYPDSATDPIHIVRRFERPDDREIVGFCAAALAFGRVASVLQSIERLLAVVGPSPAAYVRAFEPRRGARVHGPRPPVDPLRRSRRAHRRPAAMLDGRDRSSGFSPRATRPARPTSARRWTAFRGGPWRWRPRQPAREAIARASATSFRGRRPGSACKRLNLFLRWMVRRDALDLGVWTQRPAVGARRAARHARHPRRPVPRADALHEPRLGDGARDHRRRCGPSTRAIP